MTDSHFHLADAVFAADLDAVVGRARAAGLSGGLVILAAGDEAEERQAERLLMIWDEVRVAVGVHPHAAHAFADRPARAADVVRAQVARTPAARAVGEIGLDYHYDFSPKAVQRDVFGVQVQLACELDRPVVIHTREAEDDTLDVLRAEGRGAVRGVVHCFTGTPALARAALDLGFYISVAGILTFPKAAELRETIRGIPLDRLLTETDSPFLAPVPFRGKRNEPAHVGRVVEALAVLHGVTASTVRDRTSANYRALFSS
jgi:TatD DNase family protein